MSYGLEEHEQRDLIRFGNNAFKELLARLHRTQTGEPVTGRANKTRGALEYEDKYVTLLDQHKIYATLEEIADLYINDEKKMVLDFSESRELAVLQPPTKQTPMEYIGLRWSLFKSPARHIAKGQDFCYLEVMKPYIARNGRRGWAKLSHSIQHTICPDFSKTLNVNRGELYFCGVFFQETSQVGVLNGYFYYNVDRTRIPALLAPVVMKARGKNNAELINHYAKMSRLLVGASKVQVASVSQQLKAEQRCGACSNRMPKWKSKERCYFCQAFMCKKCCKIVSKNYRFDNLGKRQACFSCADEHGSKVTRMDDEDSVVSRSRTSSSSCRESQTPRTVGSVTPSSVSSFGWTLTRATSESVHQQRAGDELRHRSQTDGVQLRVHLATPTDSHGSHHSHQENHHRRRHDRDPFANGKPAKAASEQSFEQYYGNQHLKRIPSTGFLREHHTNPAQEAQPEAPAPVVDLSYLSNYK
ncbi:hypothetical protein FI667_g17264, partial [Globisporangium splendens]